jgi:hypothetical protein
MWASDKISACAEWAQAEYAWLYGLADCAGCFELTNLRVIWGRVSAIRRSLSLERLQQVFDEFEDKGLLFVWEENGKRYGNWTGSDVPGRLPPPSWRNRLERLAPAVPREPFAKYVASHSAGIKNKLRCDLLPDGTSAACGREVPASSVAGNTTQVPIEFSAVADGVELVGKWRDERAINCSGAENAVACPPRRINSELVRKNCETSRGGPLKACLEEPQVQDLGLNLDLEGNSDQENHTHVSSSANSVCESSELLFEQQQEPFEEKQNLSNQKAKSNSTSNLAAVNRKESSRRSLKTTSAGIVSPETMRDIWDQERGPLSEVRALSPERAARCRERISHALSKSGNGAQFLADFREAVARAAATPFLCGAGPTGWRANFDWLVANNTNYLKILEGRYDAGGGNSRDANAAATGSASDLRPSSGGAGSWAARAMARDESVRRELHAGAGPSSKPNTMRVRAGIFDRVFHRG